MPHNAILRDVATKNGNSRCQAGRSCSYLPGACREPTSAYAVFYIDRSKLRYRRKRPYDAPIREAMIQVASERRRFGYQRIHVMLEQQTMLTNLKRQRRLYRQEKLTVRKRGGRKQALRTGWPIVLPSRAHERWSLNFISDAFTDDRRF